MLSAFGAFWYAKNQRMPSSLTKRRNIQSNRGLIWLCFPRYFQAWSLSCVLADRPFHFCWNVRISIFRSASLIHFSFIKRHDSWGNLVSDSRAVISLSSEQKRHASVSLLFSEKWSKHVFSFITPLDKATWSALTKNYLWHLFHCATTANDLVESASVLMPRHSSRVSFEANVLWSISCTFLATWVYCIELMI